MQRPEQEEGHVVRLYRESDPNVPLCDCMDWKQHRLPCKHILAVMTFGDGCSGWSE